MFGWDPIGDIGKAAQDAVKTVQNVVSDAGKVIESAAKDPGGAALAVVSAIPGAMVTVGTSSIHGVAQVAGRVTEAAGNITGFKPLADVGRDIYNTSSDIITGSLKDPIGSGQLMVGGAMIATGVGIAPGAGMMASGAASVFGSAVGAGAARGGGARPPSTSASVPMATTASLSPPQMAVTAIPPGPPAEGESLWDDLVAWLRGVFQ